MGLGRALGPSALAWLALGAAACDVGSAPSNAQGGNESAAAGAGAASAGAGNAASAGNGGIAGGIELNPQFPEGCSLPHSGRPVFTDQMFDMNRAARREFYSWTTAEQARELRSDRVLFSKSETAGLGPGYAFTYLAQLAMTSPSSEQAQLAQTLGGPLFEKKRYAWIEPWATRLGWPGEDYGDQLLRMVLKPEAWLVVMRGGMLRVLDGNDTEVPLAEALANPRRIGAILYVKDAANGGPRCGGSFIDGGNGYREFILGNLEMIEEWSLGTSAIRERLSANIAQLQRFFELVRNCPVSLSPSQWNIDVVCTWDQSAAPSDEISAYQRALAIPSANYLPSPATLASLIETLQSDLFDPDPLLVTPGSP